jgi:hypothetical protein
MPTTLHLGCCAFPNTQRDREHVRTTKINLRKKKRTLIVNQTLSRNFSLDELETALMSLNNQEKLPDLMESILNS